jgi:hypothetical protein
MDSPTATSMPRFVPQGSARCSPEGIELSTGWEFDALTLFLDGDAELIELIQVNR